MYWLCNLYKGLADILSLPQPLRSSFQRRLDISRVGISVDKSGSSVSGSRRVGSLYMIQDGYDRNPYSIATVHAITNVVAVAKQIAGPDEIARSRIRPRTINP